MRAVDLLPRARKSVGQLQHAGIRLTRFDDALRRLAYSRTLRGYGDHGLKGKLVGLRSCVVGRMPDGETVVLVYQITRQRVVVLDVGPHDACYRALK